MNNYIGRKVIVRSVDSGVHHGTLKAVDGSCVELEDSRRLWRWQIAGQGISLSEVAILGVDPTHSKITMMLPEIMILDACEIIPTHGVASETIEGSPIAQAE